MKRFRTQSGYTMIESIAFLGIIIMLGVSVLTLISRMIDKYKLSRVGQQVVELQKAIDYRFSSAANYEDLNVALLLRENIAPSDMVANDALFHTYAGPVTVQSSGEHYSYRITFSRLPKAACVELAVQDWSGKHTAHLLTLKINDAKFAWVAAPARTLPVEISVAEELCTDNGDNNTIVWQFQ